MVALTTENNVAFWHHWEVSFIVVRLCDLTSLRDCQRECTQIQRYTQKIGTFRAETRNYLILLNCQ